VQDREAIRERTGTHVDGPLFETDIGDAGEWPFVSIIIPTWREALYIQKCLESILQMSYPPHRMEVLVVDGMSADGTREIVRRMAEQFPQIRLLDNAERLQAPGLNRGILASRGGIIIRMDAHCEYGPDYARQCVRLLKTTDSDNVGGPQRPKARTFFQRMVAIALGSKLGTGGAAYKHGRDGYVDTVFLGAFKREILRRVGLFDPGAITNEDAEINQRIVASGGKIYLSSSIECYYYPRDSVKSLFTQYFKYGRGRARTALKLKSVLRLSSFAPFLFIFGTAGLLALGLLAAPLLWAGLGALAAYLLALFGEGAIHAARQNWRCAYMLPLIFATTHFSHALGVAWGLLYYTCNPDWKHTRPPALAE
jgi:cellulose synthase/poly-beta-1,6-N-acetylglucosamine synthase-like glycosyltransferase